jgi:hypothetical protein
MRISLALWPLQVMGWYGMRGGTEMEYCFLLLGFALVGLLVYAFFEMRRSQREIDRIMYLYFRGEYKQILEEFGPKEKEEK